MSTVCNALIAEMTCANSRTQYLDSFSPTIRGGNIRRLRLKWPEDNTEYENRVIKKAIRNGYRSERSKEKAKGEARLTS